MEDKIGRRREYWTFVVVKRTVDVRGQEPKVNPVLTIEGYFIICTETVQNGIKDTIPYPLTPMGETVRIEIPPWLLKNKSVDEVSAKDVVELFSEFLSRPFEVIGPPPLDVPMHKIPPSKRSKVVEAARRSEKSGFRVPPPGEDEE